MSTEQNPLKPAAIEAWDRTREQHCHMYTGRCACGAPHWGGLRHQVIVLATYLRYRLRGALR